MSFVVREIFKICEPSLSGDDCEVSETVLAKLHAKGSVRARSGVQLFFVTQVLVGQEVPEKKLHANGFSRVACNFFGVQVGVAA